MEHTAAVNMQRALRAISLIELIVAVILLTLVVLAVSHIHIFSHLHTISSDRQVELQNEASLVLEHMAKNMSRAIGDFSNPAIVRYADGRGFRVKIDSDGDGVRDNDAIDLWIAYRREDLVPPTDSEIRFYPLAGTTDPILPGASFETIARHASGFSFDPNAETFDAGGNLIKNYIEVQVSCRWFFSQPVSPDNPEVTLLSRIQMPSVSTH